MLVTTRASEAAALQFSERTMPHKGQGSCSNERSALGEKPLPFASPRATLSLSLRAGGEPNAPRGHDADAKLSVVHAFRITGLRSPRNLDPQSRLEPGDLKHARIEVGRDPRSQSVRRAHGQRPEQ